MPIYEYHCHECGKAQDVFNRVDDRDASAPVCCEVVTERQISAPMISIPQNCHYVCPVSGKEVTSYRQRKNIMAEHGLRECNDMPPDQIIAKKKKQTAEIKALADQLPMVPGVSRETIFSEA